MWQAFQREYEAFGFTVVTVALDVDPAQAQRWIDRAEPTHPSLIDSTHLTAELFGFDNVPMAVWIDEQGMLVRPAESASIVSSPPPREVPEGVPDIVRESMAEAAKIPDVSAGYRAALIDWIESGSNSPYALEPHEVLDASRPRDPEHARAAAHFELGQYLLSTSGRDAAVPHWREAHRLDPQNWTFRRQAWTLETTRPGEASDLLQPPTAVYEGSWLADVRAGGGGESYLTVPKL